MAASRRGTNSLTRQVLAIESQLHSDLGQVPPTSELGRYAGAIAHGLITERMCA